MISSLSRSLRRSFLLSALRLQRLPNGLDIAVLIDLRGQSAVEIHILSIDIGGTVIFFNLDPLSALLVIQHFQRGTRSG